jgi:hypothetical protein
MTAPYSKPLGIDWGSSITQFIRERPNTPTWLSHTTPYQRFVSGTERTIWYQVASSGAEDRESIQTEYEEIPLSFLRDLENFEDERRKELEVKKRQERIARGEDSGKPTPSRPEDSESSDLGKLVKRDTKGGKLTKKRRLYLFYVAPEDDQFTDESDLSPFQSMLWSLVTQVLLWQSKLMGVFLGWQGTVKPEQAYLERVPRADQLKIFFQSLLECAGIPVVITLCHVERISDVYDPQSIQFLADLCGNRSTLGVPVYLVLSTPETVSMPPEIQSFQALNRYTERDGEFPFSFLALPPPPCSQVPTV